MAEKHPDVVAGSTNKYQSWEVCDPEKWVPDGYVCVRVDSRGCGRSPGYVEHWSPRETQDFARASSGPDAAVVERQGRLERHLLLRDEPVAGGGLQPKHLAAICVWEGAADFYRELSHHGGIYCTFAQELVRHAGQDRAVRSGQRGYRSRMNGDWVSGPETLLRRGDGRQPLRSRQDLFRARARRRLLQGDDARLVQDQGAAAVRRQLGRAGPAPARQLRGLRALGVARQKWLEVHGIEHWTHYYTDYGVGLQKRFFDHFLKGEKNGWDKQPRVPPAGAPSRREVRRAPRGRVADPAHQVDQVPPRRGRTRWRPRPSARGERHVRRARRRRHRSHRAAPRRRPRSPGRSRAARHLVLDQRRRPLPHRCGCSRPT